MLSALIETASQKVLASDPKTLEKLKKLDGKTIAIDIKKINISLFLQINSNSITFKPKRPEIVDVTLRAKPSSLFKIAQSGIEDAKLDTGELEIEGDAIIGQRFAGLMNELDIDWEDLISEKIGDVPARLLFETFSKVQSWAQDTQETMTQNLAEYLTEEAKITAHSDQVDKFINGVDVLRNDVARLEARLSRLSSRLKK